MGIARTEDNPRVELEELRRMLVASSGLQRRKDEEEFKGIHVSSEDYMDTDGEDKFVCVTSGVSYLGLAIVNKLLLRGYSVRIIVDNQEDVEKIREMETSGEMRTSDNISVVMAKLTEVEGLAEAFEGCRGVFHTSAFTDPAGLSGYSKSMGEIEAKAAENVMRACARTSSIRKCVLTSSLLACVWRENNNVDLSTTVVNHDCWSDESLCIDKKLWYALGKLRTEKAAWEIAKESGLKMTTICPGLITGPEFCRRNPTATIAYLKGAQEMYANGLLATVDVTKLAEAEVSIFEEMNKNACGRYIYFDNVIGRDEAERLSREIGMETNKICGDETEDVKPRFELSNKKLLCLMSRTHRRCFNEC